MIPFETKEMIAFRLKQAGYTRKKPFFTDEAIRQIYHHTQGYPRRIAMLAHDALKILVMENKSIVDDAVIKGLIAAEVR